MLRAMPANGTLCPSFEPLEPRLLLNAQVVGPELLELGGQAPYLFEFSVDIGSDTELSDPNVDGDEGFDPGDVYAQNSGPVTPPAVPGGRDGFKDDFNIFWYDPWPDPPDPVPPPNPPMTAVPVGHGTEQDYYEYFDLDGHDQIDFYLREYVDPLAPLPAPVPEFPTQCVFAAEFLMISYDDDQAPGWPHFDVPVTVPSPGGMIYGTTTGQDEIIGVNIAPAGPGMYVVVGTYNIADEVTVHQSLAPNPDFGEDEDDDVDSLDIVEDQGVAQFWLFSPDHEAHLGLDPGGIYEPNMGGLPPVQVIDEVIHLGIPEDTDIDAFEFVWAENPSPSGGPKVLTLLFSVDEDDPVTPLIDESGNMDPTMIYGSFLMGWSDPMVDPPLNDDIDALTNWRESLEEENLDWGDAPDQTGAPGYPTLSFNNGANHVIGGPWLGDNTDVPDPEPDGQPDPNALGDDQDLVYPPPNDDEDGVTIPGPLVIGQLTNIDVEVNGGGGEVGIWIDWDGSQSWEAAEQVFAGPLPDGINPIPVTPPVGSTVGQTFLRARISTMPGLPPDGPAPDGEVEDHEVYIEEPPRDWGDAPEGLIAPTYPTLSPNGANHVIAGPWLGDLTDVPDPEPDGQPHANALGDDNDLVYPPANDDEDGVTVPTLYIGEPATITVEVSSAAAIGGVVEMWLDLDGNGNWSHPGERIFAGFLPNGIHLIPITPPAGSVLGQTFLRARISSAGGLAPGGPARDGEVEDHQVFIREPIRDWGDAPDYTPMAMGYPTLSTNNGANHVVGGPWLGDASDNPDTEPDGQPDATATGDDLDIDPLNPGGNYDDENGVVFVTSPLMQGSTGVVDVTVTGDGLLSAWLDYNADYDWTDPGEQIFADVPLTTGTHTLTFPVYLSAVPGQTFVRFRYSTVPNLPPDGPADDGEVEDYEVWIEEAPDIIKWSQPPEPAYPDNVYLGWNEYSVHESWQIAADDWYCDTADPITEIIWWGSYQGWKSPDPPLLPDYFHIAIWTDIAAGPNEPFSHPGDVIWAIDCYNYTWVPDGWDYDPIKETYETAFRFEQTLNPDEWFYQDPATDSIYWISIAAAYPAGTNVDYPFGWKTRKRDPASLAPDDAVVIWDPTRAFPGDPYVDGHPIWWPTEDVSWDLAFELRSVEDQVIDKWEQLPDLNFGMDVLDGPANSTGVYEKFLADDFRCLQSGLITDITIWGSYLNDVRFDPQEPPLFNLAIYDDIPDPDGTGPLYSMPGNLLWSWYGQAVNEMPYATTVEYFFDPNQDAIIGIDQVVWQYDFRIPDSLAFQQEVGKIYWVGVHHSHDVNGDGIVDGADAQAIIDSDWAFGWKTTNEPWNDDGVWTDVRSPWGGSGEITPPSGPWAELIHPSTGASLDLSFRLGSHGVTKWEQRPDTVQFSGMDVLAGPMEDPAPVYEKFLADDFQCLAPGPITEITFWSSYLWDERFVPPAPPAFNLAIYEDIPASESPTGYSMPGHVRWSDYRLADVEEVYVTDVLEDFYDPNRDEIIGQDMVVWQYTFYIDPADAFYQEEGKIYWLGVHHSFDLNGDGAVDLVDYGILLDSNWAYGWKTAETQWNDDAVWTEVDSYGTGGEILPPTGPWYELIDPRTGESIDLSFRLTTETTETRIKWSQPPEPYVPDDGYYGWDEYSVYGGQQIVADDWLCETDAPVTDLHWWGSYLGWSDPWDPPMIPDAFFITIWTDVPAGVDQPFSHPGQVIWQHYCDNFTWEFDGWDFDPRDPMAPPEATFYFEQDIPKDNWFWQEPDDNIYWISIAAAYPTAQPPYPWGWKTRPREPDSLAPDDAVRIFDPTDPVVGMEYWSGGPIWWPTTLDSWDMAFELTTADVVPPTVVDVQVKGTGWSVPDYSIPVGSVAQIHPLGWSTIDQIEITFSEDVMVAQGDMTLTGDSFGAYAFSGFSYDPFTKAATWTLTDDIDTDVLTINLDDLVQDYAGNALDGEWADQVSTYPSGDGAAGGDFDFRFKVLPGNANTDNSVDGADYTLWADHYEQAATLYTEGDFNADGWVDGADYTIWADHYEQTVPGGAPGGAAASIGVPAVAASSVDGSATGTNVSSASAAGPVAIELDLLAPANGMARPHQRARHRRSAKAVVRRLAAADELDLLKAPDLTVLAPVV